jgi:predicted exporter
MKTISDAKIIGRGTLIVNLPVAIIMLAILLAFRLISTELHLLGLIIAFSVAWFYWAYTIKIWVQWAHKNGASEEQIFKAGRRSLLLWKKQTVTDSLK